MEPDREKQLLDEIARKDERIAWQEQRIALLEQKLDALVKRIFGSKSESLDPGQLELLLDPDAAKKPVAAESADPGPAAEPTPSRPRKGPRPPRIPEHLPVEEETLEPAFVLADPTAWRRIGEEVTERLDYRPGKFLRHRLVRPKYVRKGDPTAKPLIAASPTTCRITGRRRSSPAREWRCTGGPCATGRILRPTGSAAFTAGSGMNTGGAAISSSTKRPSNTSLPVRARQPPATCGPAICPAAASSNHWREGCDQGGITDVLGDDPVPRILQCDGYSAYPAWAKDKPHIRLMGCHAHVRRKFFEAKDQEPKLTAWLLRQLGHLYRIEKELRRQRAGPTLREAIRASQSSPIHQRLKRAIDRLALRRSILPQSLLGKAIRYSLNQWEHLTVYLGDGRVEIDNNGTENAIRPTKLGAKNWMFIGGGEAGGKTAILYTIVENCRRQGIAPADYLIDVLERLPGMTAREGNLLTPAAWLAERRVKHKAAA